MAKMVGAFQSEISEIESWKRKPNIYLAKRIAKALEASLTIYFWLKLSIFYDYGLYKD